MPITIHDLAVHRGMVSSDDDETFSAADYAEVDLAIIGGCIRCGATIAAYNAYPTRSGYWACADCVGTAGWDDAAQANADIFGSDE